MKNLFSPNTDHTTVDNLISGTLVPLKAARGELAAGEGTLLRGTLLTADEDGFYSKTEDGDIDGVLLLDVDIEDEDERIGASIAFSGEFNQNKIEEVMGGELSPATILQARKRQIYIAPMEKAPEAF